MVDLVVLRTASRIRGTIHSLTGLIFAFKWGPRYSGKKQSRHTSSFGLVQVSTTCVWISQARVPWWINLDIELSVDVSKRQIQFGPRQASRLPSVSLCRMREVKHTSIQDSFEGRERRQPATFRDLFQPDVAIVRVWSHSGSRKYRHFGVRSGYSFLLQSVGQFQLVNSIRKNWLTPPGMNLSFNSVPEAGTTRGRGDATPGLILSDSLITALLFQISNGRTYLDLEIRTR